MQCKINRCTAKNRPQPTQGMKLLVDTLFEEDPKSIRCSSLCLRYCLSFAEGELIAREVIERKQNDSNNIFQKLSNRKSQSYTDHSFEASI